MLSLVVSTTAYGPSMAPVQTVQRAATPQMGFGKAELEGARSTPPDRHSSVSARLRTSF